MAELIKRSKEARDERTATDGGCPTSDWTPLYANEDLAEVIDTWEYKCQKYRYKIAAFKEQMVRDQQRKLGIEAPDEADSDADDMTIEIVGGNIYTSGDQNSPGEIRSSNSNDAVEASDDDVPSDVDDSDIVKVDGKKRATDNGLLAVNSAADDDDSSDTF